MTLTKFLLARIAEDEEGARDASDDGHRWLVEEETITLWPDDREDADGAMFFPRKAHAYHAATWNPARILAECEAKRRIVEAERQPVVLTIGVNGERELIPGDPQQKDDGSTILRLLALPYADHPDYRPEWRP